MRRTRLTSVATYERVLPVSAERVWENVLDWEHLPSLHRDSFAQIRRVDAGDWGWTAVVRGRGAGARDITLQVVLHRDELRYVTATIEGPGKGTEIWTQLEPRSEHETAIRVEFLVPEVSPERRQTLGDGYRALYAKLWDEDEAMMVRRAKLLSRLRTPKAALRARVALGSLSDVRPKLPLVVEHAGRPWRVAEVDGALVAFSAICPHLLGPLEEAPLSGAILECPWHGYRFDVRSGRSCDGRGLNLLPGPKVEVDENGVASLIF
ncbi:MAG TPA: Rieske 2Fe-2S domain-containing protein [Myxococcota bacterium]|nr:Rieske 2Fe-2S domain-containing protein [Myxococcota bacterium]